MNGLKAKMIRKEATTDGELDRKKYRYLKRQQTLLAKYGSAEALKLAQAEWGRKADQSKGGKANPTFKLKPEVASKAGKVSKRGKTDERTQD